MFNRRQAHRYPATLDQEDAILRVGRKQHEVRILDQSVGGFCVAAEKKARVARGDVVLLGTSGGWNEMRVVRYEEQSEQIELGLEYLNHAPDSRDVPENTRERTSGPRRQGLGGRDWTGWLAVLLVVFIGGAALVVSGGGSRLVREVGSWLRGRSQHTRLMFGLESRPATSDVEQLVVYKRYQLALLQSAEVAEWLALDPHQRGELAKVFAEGSDLLEASEGASEQLASIESLQRIQRLQARALGVLTDEQRERLWQLKPISE